MLSVCNAEIGDWELVIGDWGLEIGDWSQWGRDTILIVPQGDHQDGVIEDDDAVRSAIIHVANHAKSTRTLNNNDQHNAHTTAGHTTPEHTTAGNRMQAAMGGGWAAMGEQSSVNGGSFTPLLAFYE